MFKYLSPKAETVFKIVFSEKNLLISLLNAMLPLEESQLIVHIDCLHSDKTPRRTEFEKDTIINVRRRDKKGSQFLVEIQMIWSNVFNRIFISSGKPYAVRLEREQNDKDMLPTYVLSFVDYDMKLIADGYYHHYRSVYDRSTGETIDGLQLIFIEMPKFRPDEAAVGKRMHVLWLRYLTEINPKILEAPAELLENPEIKQALSIAETSTYSEFEIRDYDRFWDNVSICRTLEGGRDREVRGRIRAEIERIIIECGTEEERGILGEKECQKVTEHLKSALEYLKDR